MHPHVFLLLLSSGVSSYFLSQKETPHVLNKTKYALIDEMLCLLEAENEHINEKFPTPRCIKRLSCAHYNTKLFIQGLKKFATGTCMRKVAEGMEKLKEICDLLKTPSSHDKSCWNQTTIFSKFKESLQEFLRWVNGKVNCSSVGRSEMTLYLDGKCSCHDLWKSLQGLGYGRAAQAMRGWLAGKGRGKYGGSRVFVY